MIWTSFIAYKSADFIEQQSIICPFILKSLHDYFYLNNKCIDSSHSTCLTVLYMILNYYDYKYLINKLTII